MRRPFTGAPLIAPLIQVFTPFFGRIHVVTHVEVPFSRAHTSCCSLLDLIVRWARYEMTAGHCLMQLGVWGQWCCKPLAGPGQSSGGGRAPQIWHLKVQNTTQKLNFVVQFPCTK